MSPIDPRIPLQIRTPKINSPMDAYSRSLHIRGQEQQNKNLVSYGTQLEQGNTKREREAKGMQTYNELLRKYTTINPDGSVKTDPTAIRGGLLRQGHSELAKKYEDARLETQKKAREADIKEIQRDRESIELIGRLVGPIVNTEDPTQRPVLYESALAQADQHGIQHELPAQYSEDLLPDLTGMFWGSMTAKEQLDDEFRRREQRTAKQKEFRDFYSNFLEVEGKPRNARSEREARQAFAKLGDAPEGRTVGVGDRIRQMNPDTGEYDRDIGPRPPSQRASGTTDKVRDAKAHSAYLTTMNKHQQDMEMEMEELQDQAMSDWVTVSKTARGIALARKYSKLFKAAAAEYRAITGEDPPQEPAQRSSQPQGPVPPQGPGQPQGPETVRKRYNPRTRKLETY